MAKKGGFTEVTPLELPVDQPTTVFLRNVVYVQLNPPCILATPHHGPLGPEGHGDLQGGLRDERSIKSHHTAAARGAPRHDQRFFCGLRRLRIYVL